jgi:hypothetical protein
MEGSEVNNDIPPPSNVLASSSSNMSDTGPTSNSIDRQPQVLKELSALVNTLTSIQEVLEDIDRLTSPNQPSSVYSKQEALINELQKWKDLQKEEG